MTTIAINPFYMARRAPVLRSPAATPSARTSRWARLPRAPINASPVPHLTSLYHFAEPGPYGDRAYPGNCGGHLIRDLLRYFRPSRVLDPMQGSGTCADVCRELAIPCRSLDLRTGFDASDPEQVARSTSMTHYNQPSQSPNPQTLIRYDSTIERDFAWWAKGCGVDPKRLRELTETGIRKRHSEARIDHEAHRATDRRPDVFTLSLGGFDVFYSVEPDAVVVRGYAWNCEGPLLDDFAGGGFYWDAEWVEKND